MRHIDNLKNIYGLNVVVAINEFPTDTKAETDLVEKLCKDVGVNVCLSQVWGKGGIGGVELGKEVVRLCESHSELRFPYEMTDSIKEKIEAIAKKIYRASDVEYDKKAEAQIKKLTELGFDGLPVCMAKTQYSFSDNPDLKGAPENFKITIRDAVVKAGAGFIVVKTGEIMTMPGLPKVPAAENIDVDKEGRITGLF